MALSNINSQPPPFPIGKANQIASDETQANPKPARSKTLEESDLRTANARELYAVRVVERVCGEPAPGAGRNYKLFKKDVPRNAKTKVGDVADAIVINAF